MGVGFSSRGCRRRYQTSRSDCTISQAGFFIEMALAYITPVAILDKKHPK